MSEINDLLTYFFSPNPGAFPYLNLNLGIAIGIILISIILRIHLRKNKEDKIFKKLFRTLPKNFQLVGILMLLYILCRYLNLPFLSMRLLNYILLSVFVYLVVKNIKIYIKEYPNLKMERIKKMQMNKYLPRKK